MFDVYQEHTEAKKKVSGDWFVRSCHAYLTARAPYHGQWRSQVGAQGARAPILGYIGATKLLTKRHLSKI